MNIHAELAQVLKLHSNEWATTPRRDTQSLTLIARITTHLYVHYICHYFMYLWDDPLNYCTCRYRCGCWSSVSGCTWRGSLLAATSGHNYLRKQRSLTSLTKHSRRSVCNSSSIYIHTIVSYCLLVHISKTSPSKHGDHNFTRCN